MVFNMPPAPLQAGNLDHNKSFRKPKPINMNMNSKAVTKKKNKHWKDKKNANRKSSAVPRANLKKNVVGMANNRANLKQNLVGIANNNAMAMAMANPNPNTLAMVTSKNNSLTLPVSRFGMSSLMAPRHYALQGAPYEAFYARNGPLDSHFNGHHHAVGPMRNVNKKRRTLSRRKFSSPSMHAPLAPRNTTSFIMRAKKLGGIAPAVTPSPATPAVLPTPLLSPGVRDKGSLEEMNKELGVDGYGSMNGLIRLRSYQDRARDGGSESESDLEQEDLTNEEQTAHSVERLEQRIDQGLSRFEMIYPSGALEGGEGIPRNLQSCVISQECVIAHLEEENLTLKERLFLVEQELKELQQRVRELEGGEAADAHKKEQFEESCGDVSTPCG